MGRLDHVGVIVVTSLMACTLSAAEKEVRPVEVVTIKRTEPVRFDADIRPILNDKCVGCHSGAVKMGDLDLSTYDAFRQGGKHGAPVVPGKAADSLLITAAGRTAKPLMPPKGETPLTPEELALLKLWIDQ